MNAHPASQQIKLIVGRVNMLDEHVEDGIQHQARKVKILLKFDNVGYAALR